ncbi:MAG TPA: phenylalanine--tRNA ligase subunit beta [Streptosporangiaceae bacterium]|nr:phenylalanine--tRNA ligase subunit beta [Streptosporangiaceae bacterium]
MLVPLSWLRQYAPVDESVPAAEVARRLTAAGLEVESVTAVGHDISGVVVAEVTAVEELTGFRKPIRYCHVTTGAAERDVICGAANFAVGDRVPFAPPGAVLPGGFEIGAKKAYGRMSEGMICSAAELAIGDDHSGILVLAADAPMGEDFASYAGLADHVLDIAVTPNMGYALSIRGIARELATAFEVPYTDPADQDLPADVEAVSPEVHPASIGDPTACDRFVLREVRGLDPSAPTPLWMRVRLARAGMRAVSLAVDITNYLMVELGQPLHAFDAERLSGPIVVRRARPGERLETLDHVVRDLDPDDILITDDSGPISMAGTMGGLATEISGSSANLVIEAAHFSARGTARMSRRHRLFSEASYRFEREVDRELPVRASAKTVALLASLGGATVVPGCTHAQVEVPPVTISLPVDYPGRVAGLSYPKVTVIGRLRDVGCVVTGPGEDGGPAADGGAAGGTGAGGTGAGGGAAGGGPEVLTVVPPSWRQDLRYPADLAEEVIRLEGYDNVPVRMPRAAAGKGLTSAQRLRRAVGRALAGAGYVEVLGQPFSSAADHDRLQLPADDARRRAPRIANPLSEDEPLLRTTLLPGLLRVLARNVGRGFGDLALYEMGLVFQLGTGGQGVAPIPRVDRGPTVAEVTEMESALPAQPLRAGVVLAGHRESPGWWGPGRPAGWPDAVEAAREVLRVSRVPYRIEQARYAPWHPGRCAAIYVTGPDGDDQLAGHAGELHPRVVQAFRLPERTCAMELDLSVIESAAAALPPAQAPEISAYPVAAQDVALVVRDTVPAAQVQAALADGAAADGGGLLEDVRLFDIYTGEQAGEGHKSLAYRLRFRAPDRTLTDEETSAARDAAVAEAARRVGAVLRDGS